MRFAILQLNCILADVNSNMKTVEKYIRQASDYKVDLVLLPEFFPSAIGFVPEMKNVALEGEQIRNKLQKLSAEVGIIIGGSYLYFTGNECYNTFDLVFPDGSIFSHHKDIPTQFENCYYTNGDENHILHTPIGEIGVALCWEMIRYDTLRRMSGKVDIVLAGSCWWDLPIDAPIERENLRLYNHRLALETPVTFAKLLNVPVLHANHCGIVTAYNFPQNDKLQTRQLIGAAQAIDGEGNVIVRKGYSEGEGLIISEVALGKKTNHIDIDSSGYWIPNLPDSYLKAWQEVNPIGNAYYKDYMRPYYINHKS